MWRFSFEYFYARFFFAPFAFNITFFAARRFAVLCG